MKAFSAALWLLVGLVHLLPVTGVLGAASLQRLYGLPITDPNLLILMQHRAVLFALVGAVMVGAAFVPAWRSAAAVVGFISIGSFLLIAWSVGGYNALIARVVWIDVAALVLLILASLLAMRARSA
ncbi:hypothetical protein [Silanimonas sp.]|jgi:hypothetical protein|uniref:hypothetical protein n=1 Tax=Silanimonas sp. TaxID=1929290 RepID=UPI0037C77E9D